MVYEYTMAISSLLASGKRLYVIWQIIFGLLVICIVLPITAVIGSAFAIGVLTAIDESLPIALLLIGPFSSMTFLPFVFWILAVLWFQILLTVVVVRAVRDVRRKGIDTIPFFWGIGMILPSIIAVFPLYCVKSRITWPVQLGRLEISS